MTRDELIRAAIAAESKVSYCVDAPERIWIEHGDECPYFYEKDELHEVGSAVTEYVRYSDYAALEAKLAEARKALERIEVRTRSVPSDTAEDDKRDKYHANSIARRALEAQGGENGL